MWVLNIIPCHSGTAPGAPSSDPSTSSSSSHSNNNLNNTNNNSSTNPTNPNSNNNTNPRGPPPGVLPGSHPHVNPPVGPSPGEPPQGTSSMAGTSQASWTSPPPGATLSYTANQNMSNNSNVSSEWVPYGGPGGAPGGGPRPANQRNAQDTTTQGFLSNSPMPEFWCSIIYFELDTQVKYF